MYTQADLDAKAIEALCAAYPPSVNARGDGLEYGGFIVENPDGTLDFTPAYTDGKGAEWQPRNGINDDGERFAHDGNGGYDPRPIVGYYHTHGKERDGFNDHLASPNDQYLAHLYGSGYYATGKGEIRRIPHRTTVPLYNRGGEEGTTIGQASKDGSTCECK